VPDVIEGFVASMPAPIASGGSEFAGWDLHPLESAALPRRTPEADLRHRSKFGTRPPLPLGLVPSYSVFADAVWGTDQMSEGRVERRLAAILAVDVAGYSRLMGADEEGTLRNLKAHPMPPSGPTAAPGLPYKSTDRALMPDAEIWFAEGRAVWYRRGSAALALALIESPPHPLDR
jgi:hypothetical protein